MSKAFTETDQRLGRLFDAIESGMVDKDDAVAKERIAGLKALRDQAAADAERTQLALDSSGNQAVTRTIGLLGGILTYAVDAGIIETNPTHGVKKPKYAIRTRRLFQQKVDREAMAAATATGISIPRMAAARCYRLCASTTEISTPTRPRPKGCWRASTQRPM